MNTKTLKKNIKPVFVMLTLILIGFAIYLNPNAQRSTYTDFTILENELESFKASPGFDSETIDFGFYQGANVQKGLDSSHQLDFFSEERYNTNIQSDTFNCGRIACDFGPLLKDDIYKNYSCGNIKKLPFNFFSEPPYMSSNGYSFVFRAFMNGLGEHQSVSWLKVHSQYLSLPEITFSTSVRDALGLDHISLNPGVLADIDNQKKVIIQNSSIFIKENSNRLLYKEFKVSDLKSHLKQTNLFRLEENLSDSCVLQSGTLCFVKKKSTDLQRAEITHKILVLMLLISLAYIGFLSFLRTQKKSKKSTLRKLALDNLTHDFRTPVTNLVLMSKDLDQIFQNSPEHDQIKWLNFSSQVHKLHRATEDTKNYTQLLADNKMNTSDIKSLNEFVDGFSDNDITINLMQKDFGINANTYWLNVCLRNLIKNARDHGGEHIEIKTLNSGHYVMIQVTDSGCGIDASFADITNEFTKSGSSRGLGLGLSIVKKACELMGGKLSYSKNPTTFTLTFRKRSSHHEKNPHC